MSEQSITNNIRSIALDILKEYPHGLRYSELYTKIKSRTENFNGNTINGSIWDLDKKYPDKIYKPSKGLFQLTEFRSLDAKDSAEIFQNLSAI